MAPGKLVVYVLNYDSDRCHALLDGALCGEARAKRLVQENGVVFFKELVYLKTPLQWFKIQRLILTRVGQTMVKSWRMFGRMGW